MIRRKSISLGGGFKMALTAEEKARARAATWFKKLGFGCGPDK